MNRDYLSSPEANSLPRVGGLREDEVSFSVYPGGQNTSLRSGDKYPQKPPSEQV